MTQTTILLAALYAMVMFCAGYFLGWLTDKDQWPREMAALLIDLFCWDRQITGLLVLTDECVAAIQKGRLA